MGMSKEELKEMIDNVIVSNGKGQITADVLNLVLNNIAENAGGGGGVKILFLTEEIDITDGPEFFKPFYKHNAEIYNTIIEKYTSLMQVNPSNANEWFSNVVNILNDSFFKAYDLFENYNPGEFFSAEADDILMFEFDEDSESNIFIKFNTSHAETYELHSNGKFIYGPMIG